MRGTKTRLTKKALVAGTGALFIAGSIGAPTAQALADNGMSGIAPCSTWTDGQTAYAKCDENKQNWRATQVVATCKVHSIFQGDITRQLTGPWVPNGQISSVTCDRKDEYPTIVATHNR